MNIRQLYNTRVGMVACVILVGMGSGAKAQPETPAKKSNIIAVQTNPLLKTPITLNAKDANLSDVLKILADRSGMNFVSGEGVYREKVTVFLNQTPMDEAIDILVRAAGLSYEIVGNSVLIAESDKLQSDIGLMGYVIELRYAAAPEVAKMLSDISSKIKVDEAGNRLICFASPGVIDQVERIVQAVDHPHILVVLETRLLEIKVDETSEFGIEWQNLSPLGVTVDFPEGQVNRIFHPSKLTVTGTNLSAVLDLMISDGKAKVLMDSKLTTTNNRSADLHIGDVIPYVIQSYNLSGSGGVNRSVEKEEVGVKISMTPTVNEASQVTLEVEPEVSSVVGLIGAENLPRTRVRRTKTTVRVGDGQTVILAGLIQDEEIEQKEKLPILGQIPIIGALFQNHRKVVNRTNLVIEITPHIVKDVGVIAPKGSESIIEGD